MKKEISLETILCAFICMFVCFFFGIKNISTLTGIVEDRYERCVSFSDFVDKVSENYALKFSDKDSFIDLNGLFLRTVGCRMDNNTFLLSNEMLTMNFPKVDMSKKAEETIRFSEFLKENGIRFLYIQSPSKMDSKNEMLLGDYPDNLYNYANENSNILLGLLKDEAVDLLDLRPFVAETPQMIEEYFYRTDHHWNYTGAFVGMQEIANKLCEIFPQGDIKYADFDYWSMHCLENWSLGSYGKRVGRFYAGLDPLIYYTPNFDTDMSLTIPSRIVFNSGTFTEAIVQDHYIETPNIYKDYCNYIYLGHDYDLVKYRNRHAPNDLRILIIKDSFSIPIQSFLSTMYSEIDALDPRYFTECGIAEYIERTVPDIVIMMVSPDVFGSEHYFSFGVEDLEEQTGKNWIPLDMYKDIEISGDESQYSYYAIPTALEEGEKYKLYFRDVAFSRGTSDGVAACLFNTSENKAVAYTLFDIEFTRPRGNFEWIFAVPENEDSSYELRLYAGIPGATMGNCVEYTDVEMEIFS